jgi:hypothetical protein
MKPMPKYLNAAVGEAVARCRRDGGELWRVSGVTDGVLVEYDLPYQDAKMFQIEFKNNFFTDIKLEVSR